MVKFLQSENCAPLEHILHYVCRQLYLKQMQEQYLSVIQCRQLQILKMLYIYHHILVRQQYIFQEEH